MVRPAVAVRVESLDVVDEPRPRAWSPKTGDNARSREKAYVSAVIASFEGGENAKPSAIVNRYVRPSAETSGSPVATSGTIAQDEVSGSSGYRSRRAQVAFATCWASASPAYGAIAGSI